VLAQLRVPADTNEHKAALQLLRLIPLEGTLLTGEAAFTQRDFCQAVVDGGGDYFVTVKDNQPALKEAIETGFRRSFSPKERWERRQVDTLAEQRNKGHGRVEYRRLRATARLNDYLHWPGLRQLCVLERLRRLGAAEEKETVLAITSLSPEQASAERLLRIARRHWSIENQLHWVRDAVMGEDACRVRTGSGPQVLAGLRNTALYLLRASGFTQIAASCRQLAAVPLEALQLVTQPLLANL
jgi:predicted transposase YbfD/YdcC